MNAIECLAVLHEENMAMVKRLLRPVDAAVQCATFAVGQADALIAALNEKEGE